MEFSRVTAHVGAPGTGEAPGDMRFGAFRLDMRAGMLYRGVQPQALRPKTWAVLLYLAQRPGALVTRDELLDAVWPDAAVTPDTLTKSIGELRQVLGDDPSTPRFIATVHRRGFRFIARAEAAAASWQPPDPRQQPFVGRDRELQTLDGHFARARGGERQIVFVTGPAGVGKTTLCDAFVAALTAADGAEIWVGRAGCIEQHGPREPYMSALSALERLARRPDGERLVGLLRRVAPTWLAQMPWLLEDDASALRDSLQTVRSERMLREFAVLIEALTAEVPVLLVLEDLHWSDPATVDLLVTLGSRTEPARLMVVGTFRAAELVANDHPLAHAVRGLRLRQQCAEVALHELTAPDVDHYLAARFPGAAPPAGLSARLHRYTDGNPLFVTAVVDHLVTRGLVLDTAPGWAFAAQLAEADLGVPDDARRMIELQYDALSPAARTLLQAASVAGQSFLPEALARALGDDAERVEAQCEALAGGQRFLRADASEGALCFAFAHELHRRAVYDSIPPATRQRLHRRFADALEALHADNAAAPPAAELAVHCERGGDLVRARRYLGAAADQAERRFATREAISYVEAAIALLPRGEDAAVAREELALRVRLWPLLCDQHGVASEALRVSCERALRLCDAVGTPHQRFEILYALCHVHGMRADRELAPRFSAAASQVARELGDPTVTQLAESIALRFSLTQGEFTTARRLGDAVFARGDFRRPLGDPRLSDALIDSVMHYSHALWFVGETSRAIAVGDAGFAAAAEHCSLGWHAIAAAHRGLTALFRRDGDGAAAAARGTRAIASGQGLEFAVAFAAILDGGALLLAGESAAAVAALHDARRQLDASGTLVMVSVICALLAEAHLRAGDFDAGLEVVEEGLRVVDETLDRLCVPELWRLKGLLLHAAAATRQRPRAWREPEAAMRRAVQTARDAGARNLEVRAVTTLAGSLAERGERTAAVELLAAVTRDLPDDPANGDVRDARKLLAALAEDG